MALYDALNLRKEEVVPVSLLLFQSIFLGFFLGAFDVGANTLFLNNFGQTMISKAIVISGLTGIMLTSLYSYFQSRLSFSTLAVINLFTVFIITFLLRAGYYFSDTRWLAFAMFVLMGPLNIIALVGFWGTVGRIFDLRQGKRIFGFIDTGQVIGVIISSLSVPFLITIGFQPKNLLYISAISIFLAFLLQFVISSKYPSRLKQKIVRQAKKSSFADTLRIPYVRTMALFVTFSMLVAFFVHYLFLSVASERFDSPDELAKFFGGLMGSLTIVSVLIKTFVYGPLMKTYGLKVSLLISPVIMILITVSAALVGSIFGYTLASGTFTFFFLLISLSKFFQKALRDSIEQPVLKLIYQSLSPYIRHEVQARVDGTINEIAALTSGILLTLLGFIGFFTLLNFTQVLLGIIVLWLFFSFRLYQGYKKTLKETLEQASGTQGKEAPQLQKYSSMAVNSFMSRYEIIELSKPWLLVECIAGNIMEAAGNDLDKICQKIRELGDVRLLSVLEKKVEAATESHDIDILSKTIDYLKDIEAGGNNPELINTLISSKNFQDRIMAARYIGASTNSAIKKHLTFLLRDLVTPVKKQAIMASRDTRSKEVISFLIDFLDKDFYAPLAHAALINSGETGLELLMLAFNRSNASETFKRRILRVIPETGSTQASRALFEQLAVNGGLKTCVLDGLLKLDFSISGSKSMASHQVIIEQAGVCAWNLNILYHCPQEEKAPGLERELEYNFSVSKHILFQMLKLHYDKSSIDAVVENLEMGTGESISFAIELLDTFMFEDLKHYIFPLLEDTTLHNKIWALQSYFPLRTYSTEELLKAIINRNENLITKESKIFALNAFRKIDDLKVSADLVAQLFNADRVLRQLSAEIISKNNQHNFLSLKKRLKDKSRIEMTRTFDMHQEAGKDILDRLDFYLTGNGSGSVPAPLFWLYHGNFLCLADANIFELGRFRNTSHIILVEKGSLTLTKGDRQIKTFSAGEMLITGTIAACEHTLLSDGNTIIHFIEHTRVMAELYDNDSLLDLFVVNAITNQSAVVT
jgi:ATP:ADP antiporter, AAA family